MPARQAHANPLAKAGQGIAAISEEVSGRLLTHRKLHAQWSRVFFDHDSSDQKRAALDSIEDQLRANIERLKVFGYGKRTRAAI